MTCALGSCSDARKRDETSAAVGDGTRTNISPHELLHDFIITHVLNGHDFALGSCSDARKRDETSAAVGDGTRTNTSPHELLNDFIIAHVLNGHDLCAWKLQ